MEISSQTVLQDKWQCFEEINAIILANRSYPRVIQYNLLTKGVRRKLASSFLRMLL